MIRHAVLRVLFYRYVLILEEQNLNAKQKKQSNLVKKISEMSFKVDESFIENTSTSSVFNLNLNAQYAALAA